MSFDQKVAEQTVLLEHALRGAPKGFAIDLGCGPGFQAIALAELGFDPVLAIDTSEALPGELDAHRGSHGIETRVGDITRLVDDGRRAAVVVCMGDTLTHLPSKEAVSAMIAAVAKLMAPGGRFVLTYRDLTPPLLDTDRFIPVQSDGERIMTCFLEYESDEALRVTDLVHLRGDSGWVLKKSSYHKLRLSPAWVREALGEAGFVDVVLGVAGRLSLVGARAT